MGQVPLAEVYEKLKELRRQGKSSDELRSGMESGGLQEIVLDDGSQGWEYRERFAELVRRLEIMSLAERVFGGKSQAEAWLRRPNPSLSNQRPADLLQDELGTAVVREMLERIDHGIFA